MSLVKSLSVGDGDMFYIIHGTDNFTIIDCCMSNDDRNAIVAELRGAMRNKLVHRFISTHPDDDHIRGLRYLDDELQLLNFYCVANAATKADNTDDFVRYRKLRDSGGVAFNIFRGCSRKWMNISDAERCGAGLQVLWPDIANEYYQAALRDAAAGNSPNNISPIIQYSLHEGATVLWMGDLETGFMESIEEAIPIPSVDILFAPHHGRDSGKLPARWLEDLDPRVIIIGEAPAQNLNYYAGYNTITQNSAGHITLDCDGANVHVYVSSTTYSVNFLSNKFKLDTYGNYIGTLEL